MKETVKIERPKHGYFAYVRGEEPRFKIGDNIAYYEFYSDYEGEGLLGKVTEVKIDDEIDDWVYEFEDGYLCPEENLIREDAYVKTGKK